MTDPDIAILIGTRCRIASRYAMLDSNVAEQEKLQNLLIRLQEAVLEGRASTAIGNDNNNNNSTNPFVLRQQIEEMFAPHVASPRQVLEVSRLVSNLVSETHNITTKQRNSNKKSAITQGRTDKESANAGKGKVKATTPETAIVIHGSDSEDDNDDNAAVPIPEPQRSKESTMKSVKNHLEGISKRLRVIEGNKADKKALLKEWRALKSLAEKPLAGSVFNASDWRYLRNRCASLRYLEGCIQKCWKRDENAFLASPLPSWPKVCQRYTCTCSAGRQRSVDANGRGRARNDSEGFKDLDYDSEQSVKAYERLDSIKARLSPMEATKADKTAILHEWRALADLSERPSARSVFDSSAWQYMCNRRAALRHAEKCIKSCWNGNEAAFIASPVASWPIICRRYDCTCKGGSDEGSTDGNLEDSSFSEAFHAAKQAIELLEKEQKDKTGLMQAYAKLKDQYNMNDPHLSPQERNWIKVRLHTLDSMKRCIDHCFDGNRNAFIALPEWARVGREYRCRCHVKVSPFVTDESRTNKSREIPICAHTVTSDLIDVSPVEVQSGTELHKSMHLDGLDKTPSTEATSSANKKQKLSDYHSDQ